jgi:hypothetical protein
VPFNAGSLKARLRNFPLFSFPKRKITCNNLEEVAQERGVMEKAAASTGVKGAWMVHTYQIEGLKIQTGDLICTIDGGGDDIKGQFWRLIGKLLPGKVDHTVVYVGPGGRCVEAGAKGTVIVFEITGSTWNPEAMTDQRGMLIDKIYGVAYPLEEKGLNEGQIESMRENVAKYCLDQIGKPYNINFLDSSTEAAFYCSQLAYKAYLNVGIDLNTGIGVPDIPGTAGIIFPQEIWSGSVHRQVPAQSG